MNGPARSRPASLFPAVPAPFSAMPESSPLPRRRSRLAHLCRSLPVIAALSLLAPPVVLSQTAMAAPGAGAGGGGAREPLQERLKLTPAQARELFTAVRPWSGVASRPARASCRPASAASRPPRISRASGPASARSASPMPPSCRRSGRRRGPCSRRWASSCPKGDPVAGPRAGRRPRPRGRSGLVEGGDARQHLALEQLEAGAAAGGDVASSGRPGRPSPPPPRSHRRR